MEETKPKMKKKYIVIIIISILVVAISILALAIPRDFAQLVMSDSAYAGLVVSKNVSRLNRNVKALELKGKLDTNIKTSDFLKSVDPSAMNEYLRNLDLTSKILINGAAFKTTMDISDVDGSILNMEMITSKDLQCMRINQLNSGWKKFDFAKQEKTPQKPAPAEQSGGEKVKFEDLIKVGAREELTLTGVAAETGTVSASGDAVTLKFTVKDLKAGFATELVAEKYRDTIDSYVSGMAASLEKAGIETVEIKMLINSRNVIVATAASLTGPDKSIDFTMVTGKIDVMKLTIFSGKTGSISMIFDMKKIATEAFEIPQNSEVSDMNSEEFKQELLSYLFKEVPNTHPAFKSTFTTTISSTISSVIGSLFGDLTQNITKGLDGNSWLKGIIGNENY